LELFGQPAVIQVIELKRVPVNQQSRCALKHAARSDAPSQANADSFGPTKAARGINRPLEGHLLEARCS
jgi:hypothetical protein